MKELLTQKSPLFIATILGLSTAFISGTSNFINKIGVSSIGDPILFTTVKNSIVAILLLILLVIMKKWKEIRRLSKKQIIRLCAIGIIGGSIPFALFFIGLSKTSAMNASLIHKTLFVWVFVFGIPILREKITRIHILAIVLLFSANIVIGGLNGFAFHDGDLMIFAATLLWAIENIIAKKALADISSTTVAASRMIIGSLVLIGYGFIQNMPWNAVLTLTFEQWGWIGLTCILLSGYVLTWYGALSRAPATYVASLLVTATLVTNVFSAVFVTHSFNGKNILSAVLLAFGLVFMIWAGRKVYGRPRVGKLFSHDRDILS